MKKKSFFLFLALVALVCLYSCTKDKTVNARVYNCTGVDSATNTYTLNIQPNITGLYCAYAPCHGGGTAQQGVDLSTYASVVTAFKTQGVVCAITGAGCQQMPNTGVPLPDSLILQMECWQQNGFRQ